MVLLINKLKIYSTELKLSCNIILCIKVIIRKLLLPEITAQCYTYFLCIVNLVDISLID